MAHIRLDPINGNKGVEGQPVELYVLIVLVPWQPFATPGRKQGKKSVIREGRSVEDFLNRFGHLCIEKGGMDDRIVCFRLIQLINVRLKPFLVSD